MKLIAILIISILNKFFIVLTNKNIEFCESSHILFTLLKNKNKSLVVFRKCKISKSNIEIIGMDNNLTLSGNLQKSSIFISGNNNSLEIGNNTSILNMKIVIRGNNCRISIKSNTSFGSGYLICMGKYNSIEIGEDCQIADDVSIWATDSHPIYDLNGDICNKSKAIKIDNHVWIGNKSVILKGVSIGQNSVIGMASVVTKDIESWSVYAGNPAKKIKKIGGWDRNFITQ